MSQLNSTTRGFTKFQWMISFAIIASLVIATLVIGFSLSERQQTQRFNDVAQKLFYEADLRVGELRNVRKSMLGMHYASDEFAGADIEAFAVQLRQYMPALHSLGMVEHVDGSLREQYEAWMLESGNDTFRIHEYTEFGEATEGENRESYLPIISIDSRDSEIRALLGTNLSAVDDISSQLPDVIRATHWYCNQLTSQNPRPTLKRNA